MRYIENEDGTVIDGFRAGEIRKFARSIWIHLANSGKAPRTWGKADIKSAQHYHQEMIRRFPELRLCAFDWKADQIATDNYPNWAANNLGPRVKGEDVDSFELTPDQPAPVVAKRPQTSQSTSSMSSQASKRKRISPPEKPVEALLSNDKDGKNPTVEQGLKHFCHLFLLR